MYHTFPICYLQFLRDAIIDWPKGPRETRPWTHWWPGSAVDKPNLTLLLEIYHQAGLGGVEITPIYGVIGQETRDLTHRAGWQPKGS